MKTLIVEDDFTSRIVLQALLSPYGECHTAMNGDEALFAFQVATNDGVPYDLLCVDILMPGLNGKEVVRRLRDMEAERGLFADKAAKIIMVTGLEAMKEVSQSFEALCDAYLTKPVNADQLLQQVRAYQLIH